MNNSIYENVKEICEKTGVGVSAFSSYLSKQHRELILRRHNLPTSSIVKLRGHGGQTTSSYNKYKDAITACSSREYIEYNISQIARIFNLDSSALSSQLRRHYPSIIPTREKLRKELGISVNLQYGARSWSKSAYAPAVSLLQSSDMTISEAASACRVSHSGLREHILSYHPHLTRLRKEKRLSVVGQRNVGHRNGHWSIHQPSPTVLAKYSHALELYTTTQMPVESIVRLTGVPLGGFRYHLRTWHPELQSQRHSCVRDINPKYRDALQLYESTSESLRSIAQRLGLTYTSLSGYIRRSHPSAIDRHKNIKATKKREEKRQEIKSGSSATLYKYTAGIEKLETSPFTIKEVAEMMSLNYHSFRKYISKHYPQFMGRRQPRK